MTFQLSFALALAALIGLSLGLLGSGGSIITLPVLVYVAGVEAHSAVAMSLVVVGSVALAGAVLHYRQGNFHARAVLLLGFTGMVGAYFGSDLTHRVPAATLMLIFAGLMLVVGVLMLRRGKLVCDEEKCYPVRCLSIGVLVGGLTGFLGVGGGFLIVPALVLLAGIDTKKAVGASLGIIALNSASGLVGQLRFANVDWPLTLAFLAIALAGMWLGTTFMGRISTDDLRRYFAWSLLVLAVVIGGASLLRG
jgi:uncharacterized membrane protein YfcA